MRLQLCVSAAIVAVTFTLACTDEGPARATMTSATGGLASSHDDIEASDRRGPPQTDDVTAAVTFLRLQGKSRQCDGQDGLYFENQFRLTGTSTGDPRLTGDVEVQWSDLFNSTEMNGPVYGNIVIRDSETKRKKAEGDFANWGPAEMVQGTIRGTVRDEGAGAEPTSGAGTLHANFRIEFRPEGIFAIIGGAASDNRLPAGIFSGRCSGKFSDVDIVFGESMSLTKSAAPAWRAPR